MFLMLKLILIISINFREMHADSMQDSKVILLPAWNSTEAEKLSLTLKVFGKVMQLNLRRNDQVLSSVFEMWKNERNVTEMLSKLKTSDFCLYLHDDYVSTAAIDICQEDGLKGFVIMDKDLVEIQPLQTMSFIHDFCAGEQINQSFGKPHLIRRSVKYFAGSDFYHLHKIRPKRSSNKEDYIIQLAVTFDQKVYNGFMKFLQFNKKKMHELAWLYVNEIQKFFDLIDNYRVKISVTYFHFMKIKKLPEWATNSSAEVLNLFCQHVNKFKPWNIDNPYYWDINLYIFGINDLNFGAAFDHGACKESFSCAVVGFYLAQFEYYIYYKNIEFYGLRHEIQQSARIAAREIAHNIGVGYYPYFRDCKDANSIMCKNSFSYKQSMQWSLNEIYQMQTFANEKYCLQDHPKPKNLDCSKSTDTLYSVESYELPGRTYNAKQQCMFLLSDENANVVTLHDVCKNLQCEVHFDNKSYFFGRPLNGTHCAPGKECCDGECVPIVKTSYSFKYCENNNWSEWEEDSCKSGCLEGSKGVKIRRRTCQRRGLKTGNCRGPYYDVILCDHSKLCNSYKTMSAYASQKCSEFSKFLNLTDVLTRGFQHSHSLDDPSIACTIFCRLSKFYGFMELRKELIEHDVDPYFPDGTLCDTEGNQNYYCRQHYCLPENHSFIEKCKYPC